ncbi:chromate efflux transporter [Thalassotalea crassostreae]|uniref:chromate efflux transporter n=1 Tax=Thalassotalea crassostreae TaxID=1763536 RepID=UPI000B780FA6
MIEIFWRYLILGLASFGGPAAHMGYFRKLFVEQLNWINDQEYAKLIALSQFLPGPGSSQVGFAIGVQRGGLAGGIAAFLGFTLPSFLLLYFLSALTLSDQAAWFDGVIHGLKILAVVVVLDATLSMFNSFCKDKITTAVCTVSAATLMVMPSITTQMLVLVFAAIVGVIYCKEVSSQSTAEANSNLAENSDIKSNSRKLSKVKMVPLCLFAMLFLLLPVISNQSLWGELFASFYSAGSLVFGGGHVVLPLLQETVGNNVAPDQFMLGYAAAQAVPGPMFTVAAFLGAESMPEHAFLAATVATLAIFLPGFLLVLAFQKSWVNLAKKPVVAGAVTGINAAVVGLLLSALYQPVFVNAVHSGVEMAAVIIGFMMLRLFKLPIVLLVVGFAVFGITL